MGAAWGGYENVRRPMRFYVRVFSWALDNPWPWGVPVWALLIGVTVGLPFGLLVGVLEAWL